MCDRCEQLAGTLTPADLELLRAETRRALAGMVRGAGGDRPASRRKYLGTYAAALAYARVLEIGLGSRMLELGEQLAQELEAEVTRTLPAIPIDGCALAGAKKEG